MKKELGDKDHLNGIILDNQPFLSWLKDTEGHYLAVNEEFSKYVGLPKGEILGKTDYDIYSKEEAEQYINSDKAILEGLKEVYCEYHLNGMWNEEYKRAALDKHRGITGIVGVCQNITQRHELEEAYRESERSMSILLSNLPGVAYRSLNDKDWTMTFLSEGCLELTGYTSEELIQGPVTYYDLMHPEDKKSIYAQWKVDVAGDGRSNDEYRIITKSGQVKWIWEQSISVPGKEGQTGFSEGFIQDISKSKKTEKALIDSEEQFKTIFEEAPLGIGVFHSVTGKAIKLNPKYAEIVGRDREELLGLNWSAYSHPEDIGHNEDYLSQMVAGEIPGFSIDKRLIRGNGTVIWVSMVITPYHMDTGEPCHLCMVEDITFNKIKEQEIEYLSYHDSLTGLYNRRCFEEEAKKVNTSRRLPISIIMGDVNGLKLINDSFGHKVGDRLLQESARLLQENCRDMDFVARIGGDEFIVILEGADRELTMEICKRMEAAFQEYSSQQNKRALFLSIALGHATKVEGDQTIDQMMKEADDQLYQKKAQSKKRTRQGILAAVKKELVRESGQTEEWHQDMKEVASQLGNWLKLSYSQKNKLRMILEFRDIGKLELPDSLHKQPEEKESTFWELDQCRKHTADGYRIALGVPELKNIAEELLAHHENWDGSGYPKGLKEEEIPLLARIVRVIDYYSQWSWNEYVSGDARPGQRMESFQELSGSLFDPKVVTAFMQVIKGRSRVVPGLCYVKGCNKTDSRVK